MVKAICEIQLDNSHPLHHILIILLDTNKSSLRSFYQNEIHPMAKYNIYTDIRIKSNILFLYSSP
jgi:hypothetical protein